MLTIILILAVLALIIFFSLVSSGSKVLDTTLEKQSNSRKEYFKSQSEEKLGKIPEIMHYGIDNQYLFAVDEPSSKILIITDNKSQLLNFSDIISVELIEDGVTTNKKSITRTIGGAVIGGAIAGVAGTIIGATSGSTVEKKKITSNQLKILTSNLQSPSILITCFHVSWIKPFDNYIDINKDPLRYKYFEAKKSADEIKDVLFIIIDKNS